MPVQVPCPNPACGRLNTLPDDTPDGRVRCAHCGSPLAVPAELRRTTPAGRAGTGALPPPNPLPSTVGPVVYPPPADYPPQIGRFQVRARLGGGTFGAVYRAYDPHLEREVALKVPHPSTFASGPAVERFLREARAAARLRHPHIVAVYEAGQGGGGYFIAAALIEGRTLAELLEEGPLDCRRAARIVRDLAEALAYAHAKGIVHRDVKPTNVMVDAGGNVHLMDFGLARFHDAASKLTRHGDILGTPAYMSPEQAQGQAAGARPATDQYSLGVVLYELLCGRIPFEGPSEVVLYHTIHQPPPPPRTFRPDIPPALEAICLRAMAKRPEERYPGCRELAEALDRWLERPEDATEPPPGEPTPTRARRKRAWATLAAGGAAALALAVWMVLSGASGDPDEEIPLGRSTPQVRPVPRDSGLRAPGRFFPPGPGEHPALLLRRAPGAKGWQLLSPANSAVRPGDSLVSLPGYHSEVHFGSGLRLTLWGDLPELSPLSPLLESGLTLHGAAGVDLDLTLDRGRLLLANDRPKAPAVRVRVRFENPVATAGQSSWEIILPPGAAVSVERWGRYAQGVPFDPDEKTRQGPDSELYLVVLRGQVEMRVQGTTFSMEGAPGPGLLGWNSRGGTDTPRKIARPPDWAPPRRYSRLPPGLDERTQKQLRRARADMLRSLRELARVLAGRGLGPGLLRALHSGEPLGRVMAVRCFGALDDLDTLLDGLTDYSPEVRETSIADLRHWIGLHLQNDLLLHDVLRKKRHNKGEARTVVDLLHTFSAWDLAQPETYATLIEYLRQSNKVIRVLAYWHLVRLVPEGRAIPYDPVGNPERVEDPAAIERAYRAWKELVPEGNLPSRHVKTR
jgi:serine/threonine protein kinase